MEGILNIVDNYIIILDYNGRVQFCNKELLKKLSYSLEELKNINIQEITWDRHDDEILKIIKHKLNQKIQLDLRSKEEETISIYGEITIDEFKGSKSLIFVGKDITEKTYKINQLDQMLDNMPFDCWMKNNEGQYIYVNESYAKKLNSSKYGALGKTSEAFWNEGLSSKFEEMDNEVIQSKKYQLTETYSNYDGLELWTEVYKAPVINNDEVEYIIGYTKDITLQRKLENEMYINNHEINNLNKLLAKAKNKNTMEELLTNVGDSILNYFECDGVSIVLVNRQDLSIDLSVDCGVENQYPFTTGILESDRFEFEKLSKAKYMNLFRNVNDVDDLRLRYYMIQNKIEYLGMYNIFINDDVVGLLSLKFLKGNNIKFNRLDYIKSICENIAAMVKNQLLSQELQNEFDMRKRIENELEHFLDISVDLLAKLNLKGDINHFNSNWSKNLGWSEDELKSMNIIDLVHKDYKDEYRNIIKGIEDSEGYIVSQLMCKDKSFKWVELNYKILRNEEKFIITVRDITEVKKQEEKRKRLEEAIQMEGLKNEFFANISHEFRTPLNIILGTMQLMQSHVNKGKIQWDDSLNLESHINYIKQNSYRLLRLVNNLIDITSIDSGYYNVQLGNYNIVDIVENITLSVAQYVKDKGIDLTFDTNYEEKIIACDPDKIERIVLNLLSNAIKNTDNNGSIDVNVYVCDEIVKVSVKDNGLGISEDKLDVIFNRFKKLDNYLNRKCEGSGIGLSLVKSLVELQGGKIYVDSKLGEGSDFTFELPISLVKEDLDLSLNKEILKSTQIEKCNIEFSDIYS